MVLEACWRFSLGLMGRIHLVTKDARTDNKSIDSAGVSHSFKCSINALLKWFCLPGVC